jgi:hypothetical protein
MKSTGENWRIAAETSLQNANCRFEKRQCLPSAPLALVYNSQIGQRQRIVRVPRTERIGERQDGVSQGRLRFCVLLSLKISPTEAVQDITQIGAVLTIPGFGNRKSPRAKVFALVYWPMS